MGEVLQVEFDKPKKQVKPTEIVIEEILDKIVNFMNKDIDNVIEYIDVNDIPVHFIIAGKRIDLHPAREYLLRTPRVMRDVIQLKKIMNDDNDDLDTFFNDEK